MSAVALAAAQPTGLPTRAISKAALWLAVFLGGFVFYEPSPYDLYMVLLIPAWLLVGLKVPRATGPLVVLLLLFLAGGVLAATQAHDFSTQPLYYAVTAFLVLSACFYAAIVAEGPGRLDTIVDAWIAGAVITALLGIAAYAGLTGDMFLKFGRATGGFQDPNVFGPFLIFPLVMLVRRVIVGRGAAAIVSGLLAMVVLIGIFLSFSRAAWGFSALALMLMGAMMLATERSGRTRTRLVVVGVAGVVAVVLMIVVALNIPAVSDLLEQRAQLEQSYDVGHLGRFQRHAIGFNMMLDHPLGIGSLEFGRAFGEDEHDIWLKSLTTYGWLGFAAYVTLVVWTLAAAFPLAFRSGPMQATVQIAFVVLLGHFIIATVIDIDHWRHVYLLFGLLWGAIAYDRRAAQQRLVGPGNRVMAGSS